MFVAPAIGVRHRDIDRVVVDQSYQSPVIDVALDEKAGP